MTEGKPPRRRPGPKPSVSLDQVLDAAASMPYGKLTMTAVAAELGVSTPTIYCYVDNKDALVELLVARLTAALDPPDPDQDWRDWLHELAAMFYQATLENPILVDQECWFMMIGALVRVVLAAMKVLGEAGITGTTAYGAVIAILNIAQSNAAQRLVSAHRKQPKLELPLPWDDLTDLVAVVPARSIEEMLRDQVAVVIAGAEKLAQESGAGTREGSGDRREPRAGT